MRKLATIRKIKEIRPIEGADAIECVVVDGWQVVAKKGEFQEGDLCVYFEIDSVLPVREEFEFLRRGCYVKKDWLVSETNPEGEGFRLKTIRLRGQISQGLVIPFPEYGWNDDDFYEGADITDHMDVVKWDPPVPATMSGKVRGNFPSYIPKTDQERVQNLSYRDIRDYADDNFEVTTKMDGSSMTVYRFNNDGDIKTGVCSRRLDLDIEQDTENTFTRTAIKTGLLKFLEDHDMSVAIQGELMGPGIQGNRENLKEHKFFMFDVYDIKGGRYLRGFERFQLFASITAWQDFNAFERIEHCPLVNTDFSLDLMFDPGNSINVERFLAMADGPSWNPENKIREGIVFKSRQNPDFSFKVISNSFLLKGGE